MAFNQGSQQMSFFCCPSPPPRRGPAASQAAFGSDRSPQTFPPPLMLHPAKPQSSYNSSESGTAFYYETYVAGSSTSPGSEAIPAASGIQYPLGDNFDYRSPRSVWQVPMPLSSPQSSYQSPTRTSSHNYASIKHEAKHYSSSPPLYQSKESFGNSPCPSPVVVSGRSKEVCAQGGTQGHHSYASPNLIHSLQPEQSPPGRTSPTSSGSNEYSSPGDGSKNEKKRPQTKGYVSTLDSRLSKLELMLGELVPTPPKNNPPGGSNSKPGFPGDARKKDGDISKGCKTDAMTYGRGQSLNLARNCLLNGAVEDALWAVRPVQSGYSLQDGRRDDAKPRKVGENLSTAELFLTGTRGQQKTHT